MMSRPTAAAVILLTLTMAPAADAAPKPKPKAVCDQVVDDRGDAKWLSRADNSPGLDILKANFATGAKTIVGSIQVDSLDKDALMTYQAKYVLKFAIDDREYSFQFIRNYNGSDRVILVTPGRDQINITGSIDQAKKTVIFNAQRSVARDLKPGSKISAFEVQSWNSTGVGTSDTAVPSQSGYVYVDRYPSCLAPK